MAGECCFAGGGVRKCSGGKAACCGCVSAVPWPRRKVLGALALARVGDTARAKVIAGEVEKSNPTNTVLKLYWLPTIKAAIESNSGSGAQALSRWKPLLPMNWASHLRRKR